MRKYLAKVLSIGLALSIVLSSFVLTPVLAGASYNQGLTDIFAGASDTAKEANPWEYKGYLYGRREAATNDPKLTITYIGDNQVKVVARYNTKGGNWTGRPFIGLTVPNGFAMPTHIIRRKFYGEQKDSENKIAVSNWRSGSRYADFGRLQKEWENRAITVGGYDGNQGVLEERFKDLSQAYFLSWEKAGTAIYELEYTTTVTNFKAKNNVLATLSQVPGRWSRHAGIYAANPKPVPPPPPAPKMSETYDLKRPAPLPVADPANALTSEEQNQVIQKIKEVNPGLENIAAVSYDAGAKTFKVVFNKDQSEIVVPQKDLVYKKPAPKVDVNNLPFKLGDKVMLENKEQYDNIRESNTNSNKARKEAIVRWLVANGVGAVHKHDQPGEYGNGLGNVEPAAMGGNRLDGLNYNVTNGSNRSTVYFVDGNDRTTYYLGEAESATTDTGFKLYSSPNRPGIDPVTLSDAGVIPWEKLFTYPNDPNNSDPNAITPDDKQDIRDAINRILDPSKFPGIDGVDTARDNLLNQVDGKNTRDELNALLTEANNKASEFALALANKKLDVDKERAKKIINGLTELSEERKKELIGQVDALRVTDQKSYDAAKTELDNIVKTALTEDLTVAKGSAENVVGKLPNPITDNSDKDVFKPIEVTNEINRIETDNLTETTHAEKIAEINKLKEKAQIDSAREEMLKKLADSNLPNKDELSNAIINNAPDGTGTQADQTAKDKIDEAAKALEKAKADAAKEDAKKKIDEILPPGTGHDDKANELKQKIDNAKSTDEIESILEEARVHKEKADALAKIEALTHLNQAQKNAYKQLINNVQTREDLAGYLNDATELDNSMADLIAEVNKSKDIKDNNKSPYDTAGNTSKEPFHNALTEAEPIVNLNNAEATANLDNDAVTDLLDKLKKARLGLSPDNQPKSENDLAKARAEELKNELREKNKAVKEEIKNLKDDYSGFAALGDKDTADAVGTIITEAERKITEELAKLDNGTATAEAVNDALDKIKNDTLVALDKEKLKAAIEKLDTNIKSEPDKTEKTQASIDAYEAEKTSAEETKTEAEAVANNNDATRSDLATALEKVLEADKKLTAKEQLEDDVNVAGLREKVTEIETLLQQARPTKYVKKQSKDDVVTLKDDAHVTLDGGDANQPSILSAKGILAKDKPTKKEVDDMINILTGKITTLTNALNTEKTDAKNKLDEIVTALFPQKNGAEDPNKQTFLDKVAKLTNVQEGDPDKEKITNTPDAYINEVLTAAIAAAVDGYTHLNDAQKDAAKADLLKKAEAITADGNVETITTAIAGLKTLDEKMVEVAKLKEKGDIVKKQVKYLKEGTEAEKTAFDDAVTALNNVITVATGENKDVNGLDALITAYNNALANLDGKASAPNPRVTVTNPNHLEDAEKDAILNAIIAANRDIENKIDRANSSVSETGVVTLVYNDGANTTANETVEKTGDTTFQPNEVLVPRFQKPAKTLVSLGENGNLSAADKDKVKDAVLAANPELTQGNPALLTKENITVNDDGSVSVQIGGNYTENITADEAVDKTTKPEATQAVNDKKASVKAEIEKLGLDKDAKDRLLAELDKLASDSNTAIAGVHTDLTSPDKAEAYNTAVGQVAPLLEKAKFDMDKLLAKAELEKYAQDKKAEIDRLTDLSVAKREELKAAIDQALNEAKKAIDQAQDNAGITPAKDAGKLAMDKITAKAEIENKGETLNKHIDSLKHLTDAQRKDAKAEIAKIVQDATAAVDQSNSKDDIRALVEKAKVDLDKVKAKVDIQNEGEKIKDYVNIVSTLTDDQKKDFKDQVDKVVKKAIDALNGIDTTGDIDQAAQAVKDEKAKADERLNAIKEAIKEKAKPILDANDEAYNPWVKLVFDTDKESEKDLVPNTGARRS